LTAFFIISFTFFLLPFGFEAALGQLTTGQPVPDFELVDHKNAPFRFSETRRSVVVVTFIYTRCPLPEFCPHAVANLSALRSRYRGRLGKDLTLLTITLDPIYDTPGRLGEYATRTGTGGVGWRYLTGTRKSVERVLRMFGMEAWPEEGAITHELVTLLIDRRGRLNSRFEGTPQPTRLIGNTIARLLKK
jgi:protein SCO1/2